LQTPAGERYTRNGAFTLNAQGQLVTSDGHTVMGESGPIAFSPQETGIEIGADGTVSTTQGQRGKLRLVRFADPQTLRNEGSNVFSSTAPAQAAGTAAQVQAGAIERSNVKPVIEMSRLIDVNRSYTTISTMLTRMDELRRTALSRLSDQNA
jgi:flagellar basal-body rod protein FlgF